jgi:hypothetical protein
MIKIKFLAKQFLYYNFILQPLHNSAQHFYEKREGSGAGSASGSVLVTNESGSGSGRPKNIGILRNTKFAGRQERRLTWRRDRCRPR